MSQNVTRDLLRFAIRRIAAETDVLAASYMNPKTKRIEPASIATEVRENRVWLAKAKRAARS